MRYGPPARTWLVMGDQEIELAPLGVTREAHIPKPLPEPPWWVRLWRWVKGALLRAVVIPWEPLP